MNPLVVVSVTALLVLQSAIPDITAQLVVDQANPYVLIGVRAGALAVGIALNLLDRMGEIRRRALEPESQEEGNA